MSKIEGIPVLEDLEHGELIYDIFEDAFPFWMDGNAKVMMMKRILGMSLEAFDRRLWESIDAGFSIDDHILVCRLMYKQDHLAILKLLKEARES